MICYSWLEKRGDYIKKYINWCLFSNNKLIIKKENIECEITNNILKYQEEKNFINKIDMNNDIFIRESNEFLFKIDFKKQSFEYTLKEKDLRINDVLLEAKIIKNEIITLIYKIEDEEKKIIIQIL